MPNPTARYSGQLPSCMEPSRYQVYRWSQASLGATSQLNHPSDKCVGTGSRNTSRPRVRSKLARASPMRRITRSVFGGAGGQPFAGVMHAHTNLCSRVPGAARQSRHLLSLIPHRGTEARRAWGHCPPEIAEARCPLNDGCHCSTLATLVVPLCSKPFRAPGKSISMELSDVLGASASQTPCCKCGSAFSIRASRHLRTDLRQAWVMAAG